MRLAYLKLHSYQKICMIFYIKEIGYIKYFNVNFFKKKWDRSLRIKVDISH